VARTKLHADVSGTVWKVVKRAGEALAAEEPVVILESMKMEIPVAAPAGGRRAERDVKARDAVKEGEMIALLDLA
jgi:acetyl-CoA carboxylase biotin carboxyl carrier protein